MRLSLLPFLKSCDRSFDEGSLFSVHLLDVILGTLHLGQVLDVRVTGGELLLDIDYPCAYIVTSPYRLRPTLVNALSARRDCG